MKSDKTMMDLFSQFEKEVALSVLKGTSIASCARLHGISMLKCQTIVNTYCAKPNRPFYDTLRWNPYDFKAPITQLRAHAQEFIAGAKLSEHITLHNSIWALPGVPIMTLNGLEERGISTINKLLKYDEYELKKLRKIGKDGLDKWHISLEKYGFCIKGQR